MNKIYTRVIWKNKPSTKSPLNETNLNKMDLAIDMLDDEAVQLDTTKADKIEMQPLIKDWKIDENTGIITITRVNGEQILFDLNIEKIPVSFVLSEDGILTMTTDDGTEFTADIGSMIPVLTFESSDTIAVSVSGEGKDKTYSFSIRPASVTEDMLQPNFLADVKVESGKAVASAQSAAQSAHDASDSAEAAEKSEQAAAVLAASASQSEKNASQSATQAAASAQSAAADKAETERLAGEVADDLQEVTELATQAGTDAGRAETAATAAKKSADTAGEAEKQAKSYSDLSQSYAVGTGNVVRENDDADNSKYYYEQSKRISQGFTGLIPMGTVTFEQLSELQDPQTGWLYNISNAFTSNETFQGGAGVHYGAGSNVYRTADGYWDVLAGNAVTGIAIGTNGEMKQGNVTVPTATGESIGLTKPDGKTLNVGADGTLSVADGFVPDVKIATTQAAGIVKPDGKTITVDEDGTITGASTEFTGTTQEYEQAKESGEIAEGTIVNITDDYTPGSGGGASITVDSELLDDSENPVQNKAIKEKFDSVESSIGDVETRLSDVEQNAGGGGSVTLDAEVTQDSENAVKSSGIHKFVQNIVAGIGQKITELGTIIANVRTDLGTTNEQASELKESLKDVAFSGAYSDLTGTPQIPTVPDALKNPHALKFTGAVTESYDGSEEKTVNIPNIIVDEALSDTSENPVQNKAISLQVNELKKSVSDGKALVAGAITEKGVQTAADADFATMADNIASIKSGFSISEATGILIRQTTGQGFVPYEDDTYNYQTDIVEMDNFGISDITFLEWSAKHSDIKDGKISVLRSYLTIGNEANEKGFNLVNLGSNKYKIENEIKWNFNTMFVWAEYTTYSGEKSSFATIISQNHMQAWFDKYNKDGLVPAISPLHEYMIKAAVPSWNEWKGICFIFTETGRVEMTVYANYGIATDIEYCNVSIVRF